MVAIDINPKNQTPQASLLSIIQRKPKESLWQVYPNRGLSNQVPLF